MRIAIGLAALALAGCAGPRPAAEFSNIDICKYTMQGGQNATVAQAEANRRGLDCTRYYGAIQAQRNSEAAALQNAANYFNRPAPPMPLPPQPINCTSRRVGNTVQTDCW